MIDFRKSLIVLIVVLVGLTIHAQDIIVKGNDLWRLLADVSYDIKKDEYGDLFVPIFGKDTKDIEGKMVEVEGFIIPFDGMFKPTQLILSSLPISECFFCGSGGPETVMEVSMKEKIKYTTKRVKIKGKLKLNSTNPDKLMYILEEGVFTGLAETSY